MAYIWLRFGNLKYGTATMVAMIHDTLLVLAAIGLSHLIYHYTPGRSRRRCMLEPFRLNITMVAAVLTVMSYSMIDTIVVFDRVRENRGKFGHLDRKIDQRLDQPDDEPHVADGGHEHRDAVLSCTCSADRAFTALHSFCCLAYWSARIRRSRSPRRCCWWEGVRRQRSPVVSRSDRNDPRRLGDSDCASAIRACSRVIGS